MDDAFVFTSLSERKKQLGFLESDSMPSILNLQLRANQDLEFSKIVCLPATPTAPPVKKPKPSSQLSKYSTLPNLKRKAKKKMNGGERPPLAPKPTSVGPTQPPVPKPRKNPPPKPVPYRQHRDNKQKEITTFKSGLPVQPRKPVPPPPEPSEKQARRYSDKGEPSTEFFRKPAKKEPVQYAIPEVPKRIKTKALTLDSRPRLNTPLILPDPKTSSSSPVSTTASTTPSVNGHVLVSRKPSREGGPPPKPARTGLEGELCAEAYHSVGAEEEEEEEEEEEGEGYAVVKREGVRKVTPTAAPRTANSSSSSPSSMVVSPLPPAITTPPPSFSSSSSSSSSPLPPLAGNTNELNTSSTSPLVIKPRSPLLPPPVTTEDSVTSPPAPKPRSPLPPPPPLTGDGEYSITSHKSKPPLSPPLTADSEYSVTSHAANSAPRPRSPLPPPLTADSEYSVTSHSTQASPVPRSPIPHHLAIAADSAYDVTSHRVLSPPLAVVRPHPVTEKEVEYSLIDRTDTTTPVTVVNGEVYSELATTTTTVITTPLSSVFPNPTVAESYGHLDVHSSTSELQESAVYEEIKPEASRPVPLPRNAKLPLLPPPPPSASRSLSSSEQPASGKHVKRSSIKLKTSQLQTSRDRSVLPAYQSNEDIDSDLPLSPPPSSSSPAHHQAKEPLLPPPPPTVAAAAAAKPKPPPKPKAPTAPARRRKNRYYTEESIEKPPPLLPPQQQQQQQQQSGDNARYEEVFLTAGNETRSIEDGTSSGQTERVSGRPLPPVSPPPPATPVVDNVTLEQANYETWRTSSPLPGTEGEADGGGTLDKKAEVHSEYGNTTGDLPEQIVSPKCEVDIDQIVRSSKPSSSNISSSHTTEIAASIGNSEALSLGGLELPGQEWGPDSEDKHTSAVSPHPERSLGLESQQVIESLRARVENEPIGSAEKASGAFDNDSGVLTVHRTSKTDALGYCDMDIDTKLVVVRPEHGEEKEKGKEREEEGGGTGGPSSDSPRGGGRRADDSELTESAFFTVKSHTRVGPEGYCDVDVCTSNDPPQASAMVQVPATRSRPHEYCDVDLPTLMAAENPAQQRTVDVGVVRDGDPNSELTPSAFFTVKSSSKLNPQGYWDVELADSPSVTTPPAPSSSSSSSSTNTSAGPRTDPHGYCDIDIQSPTAKKDTVDPAQKDNGTLEPTESAFLTAKSSSKLNPQGYCDVEVSSPPSASTKQPASQNPGNSGSDVQSSTAKESPAHSVAVTTAVKSDPRGYCEVDVLSPPLPLPKDTPTSEGSRSSRDSEDHVATKTTTTPHPPPQGATTTTASQASNFGYYEIELKSPPPGKSKDGSPPSSSFSSSVPPVPPATRPKPRPKQRICSTEGSLSGGSPEPLEGKGGMKTNVSETTSKNVVWAEPNKDKGGPKQRPIGPPRRRAPPPPTRAVLASPKKPPMSERVFSSGLATLPRTPKNGKKKPLAEKSATLPGVNRGELEGFLNRRFQSFEASAPVQMKANEDCDSAEKTEEGGTSSIQSPGLRQKFKGLFKMRGGGGGGSNSTTSPTTPSESSNVGGFMRRSFRKKKKPMQSGGGRGGGGGEEVHSPMSPTKTVVCSPQEVQSYEADVEDDEEEEEDEAVGGGIYSVVGGGRGARRAPLKLNQPPAKANLLDMDSHGYEVVDRSSRKPKRGQSLRQASSMEHLYDTADDKVGGAQMGGGAKSADNSPKVARRPNQLPAPPAAAAAAGPHPLLNSLADPNPKPAVDLTGLYATVSNPTGSSEEKRPSKAAARKDRGDNITVEKHELTNTAPNAQTEDTGSVPHSMEGIVVTSLDKKYGKPEGVLSEGDEPILPSSEIVHTVSGGDVYAVVNIKKPTKKKKALPPVQQASLLSEKGVESLDPASSNSQSAESHFDPSSMAKSPVNLPAASKQTSSPKVGRKPPPSRPVPYGKPGSTRPSLDNAPPPLLLPSPTQNKTDKATSTTSLEGRLVRMSVPSDIIAQGIPSRPLPTPPSLSTSVPTVSPISPMADKIRAASLSSGPPSFPPPPPPMSPENQASDHTYEALGQSKNRKPKKKKSSQVPFSRFESRDGDMEDNDIPEEEEERVEREERVEKEEEEDEDLYSSIDTDQRKKIAASTKTMSLPRNFHGTSSKTSPQMNRPPHVYSTVVEAANGEDSGEDDSGAEDDRRNTVAVPMRSHVYETLSEARQNREKTRGNSSSSSSSSSQKAKLMKNPKLKPKTVPPPAPPSALGVSKAPSGVEQQSNSLLSPPKKLSLSKQASSPPPLRRDSIDPALSPAPLLQRSGSLRITGTPTDPHIGKRIHVAMEMAGNVSTESEGGGGVVPGNPGNGGGEPRFLFSQNRSRNFIMAGDSDDGASAPSPRRVSSVTTATSTATCDEDSDGDMLYSTDWETSSGEEDDEELGTPKPARSKTFYIAQEVLTTERTFVKGLTLLDKDFRQAVRSAINAHEKPVIPDEALKLILGNVGSLRTLNSGLLQELEERMSLWETNPKIGDIILSRAPYFKLYTEYISRFDKALKTLEDSVKRFPLFGEVVREFESQSKCARLPLAGYMLDIVTRIPRYKLLLTDYVKHLPSDSEDKAPSEKALEIVSSVATHVNETIRQMDNFRKVVDVRKKLIGDSGDSLITPYRKLLKEGELLKSARKDKQPRMFFLFSDILIYASSIPPANTTYKVVRRIPLDGMRVAPLDDPEMRHGFQIISTCKSFRLEASSGEEKRQWLTAFELAIKEHNELARNKEEARMSMAAEEGGEVDDTPIGHLAPPWLPDSAVSMCQLCSVTFTVTRRRHHCRACGMIFCAQCSHYSAPLKYKESKPGRVCQSCYEKITSYGSGGGGGEEVDGGERVPTHLPPSSSHFRKSSSLKRNVNMPSVLREVKARDQNAQMSGYMLKSTSKSRRWKKRWFVVYNLVIFEFERHEDVSAKKSVTLPSYQVISPIPGHDDPLVFSLKHPGAGKFYFKADSEEQLAKWIDVLRKAVRGEIDGDQREEGREEGEEGRVGSGGGVEDSADDCTAIKTGDSNTQTLDPET